MMNDIIINEFRKLIKQIKFDIDHSKTKKDEIHNMHRLKATMKVITILETYPQKITSVKQMEHIKNIGKKSLLRIDEILRTGKLSEINDAIQKDDYLKYIDELKEIIGIGSKTAYQLYNKYKITSIEELKKLHQEGKITLSDNIIKGLKYYGITKEHIPREEINKISDKLHNVILNLDPELFGVICGSYRRLQLTSNDIDMLLVHPKITSKKFKENKKNYLELFVKALINDGIIIDYLTNPETKTKFMGFCQLDSNHPIRRIDIRYMPYDSYYYAILYFTGPGSFNERMRLITKDLGYLLNEYGLYDENGKLIKVNSEKEIFDLLGMEYIPPNLRK